jgi:hypothetical protein
MILCRIPDDSIQFSRWPLFFAREVLREVMDLLKAGKGRGDGISDGARETSSAPTGYLKPFGNFSLF